MKEGVAAFLEGIPCLIGSAPQRKDLNFTRELKGILENCLWANQQVQRLLTDTFKDRLANMREFRGGGVQVRGENSAFFGLWTDTKKNQKQFFYII